MKIIGCDFHPSYQPVAWLDTETGEVREATLAHENGEARRFYESLRGPVRVGMEAVGNTLWFERLLAPTRSGRAGLGHEVWIGDAAHIRSLVVRRQKTDRRDALHVLELLTSDRFPRIGVPGPEQRDTCPLLLHRHKRVRLRAPTRSGRARVKNELRRADRRLAQRKHTALARVMVARKLAVRWYWMLRSNQPYAPRPAVRMPGGPSHSVVAV